MSDRPVQCPSCAASVKGKFCSQCGTLARETTCAVCSAALGPGDRFCGECASAVGAAAAPATPGAAAASTRPTATWWIGVGALAATLLVALYLRFGTDEPPQQAALQQPATAGPLQSGGPSAGVLSMSPQQQADALFDRVMRLSEEGKRDSVQFFAPMAMAVYEQLQPLDLDQRFDLGTIALAAGMHPVARAHADTILQKDPVHLLGLALLSRAARAAGSVTEAERADARFRQAADGEWKKKGEKAEYERHRIDIETELKRLAAGR